MLGDEPAARAAVGGLDWVATVPPTVRLTADTFGAATAALGGRRRPHVRGHVRAVFLVAGVLAVGAALLSLAVATNQLASQPASWQGAGGGNRTRITSLEG